MIHFIKNLPLVFIFYKKIVLAYQKFIFFLIGSKYFDRQISEINKALIYLSNKKQFLKKTIPPLNGQKIRTKIVEKIFSKKIISVIFETGTYYGSTAEYLSKYKIPINTCEISPANYFIAKDRLKNYKNITVENCDSYEFLKKKLSKSNKIFFFYLDAHAQNSKNPLLSELEIIFKNLENFIILIDDFLVPHDNKYGYDSDNGSVLKFKYIEKILSKEKCHYFYPKGKSKFETGYKRGSIYIAGGKKCKALCGSIGDLIKY